MCKERAASDSYVCGFFGYATVIYLLYEYVVQRIINDDSLNSVFILNECNQTGHIYLSLLSQATS